MQTSRHVMWFVPMTLALIGCGKDQPTTGGAAAPGSAAAAGGDSASGGGAAFAKVAGPVLATGSKTRGAAKAGADPSVDFKSFKDAVKAGDKVAGKSLVFRGYVSAIKAADGTERSHLMECAPTTSLSDKEATIVEASFTQAQRDVVRALPSRKLGKGDCPRIHVKLTGLTPDIFKRPMGSIVDVYDVQPDPAPAPPSDAQFLAVDDVLMAGKDAVGKIVDTGVYLGHADKDRALLYNTGCVEHGGWNAGFRVKIDDKTRDALTKLPKGQLNPTGCQRVRLKITAAPTAAFYNTPEADLVALGDTYPLPSPAPNP